MTRVKHLSTGVVLLIFLLAPQGRADINPVVSSGHLAASIEYLVGGASVAGPAQDDPHPFAGPEVLAFDGRNVGQADIAYLLASGAIHIEGTAEAIARSANSQSYDFVEVFADSGLAVDFQTGPLPVQIELSGLLSTTQLFAGTASATARLESLGNPWAVEFAAGGPTPSAIVSYSAVLPANETYRLSMAADAYAFASLLPDIAVDVAAYDVTLSATMIPVPGAGLLGVLGLGAASWRLRRRPG